jgi:3-(3-hydroxy-phenyl)propionate hydroxylase
MSAAIYTVHQRVAKRFRSGRAILAGDAAHVNPDRAMGMNSGVHDASTADAGLGSCTASRGAVPTL